MLRAHHTFTRYIRIRGSLRCRLCLRSYGRQTGFLRRMLFSVVTARWQGYEVHRTEGSQFIFYFYRDLASGARIPAFVDPYRTSFSSDLLCSYLILLIHICSQWSREVNILSRTDGTTSSSSKSFYLMKLAKLYCETLLRLGAIFWNPVRAAA